MPMIDMDMDEVVDTYSALPSGRYLAKLVDVEEGTSAKDNPMWIWSWELLEEFKGKTIKSFTSELPHALGSKKQHLAALGQSHNVKKNTSSLHGKTVILVVVNKPGKNSKTGEDEDKNLVTAVYPPPSKQAGAGAGKAGAGKAGAKGVPEEDIPF